MDRPVTKLIEVTIGVRDVERSRRFYQELGVECGPIAADEPGGPAHVHATWGRWAADSDDFLMLNIYPADPASAPASLGFASEHLDELHQRLVKAGVEVVRPPEKRPWGEMGTYRDPDGNLISVSQRPTATNTDGS